MQGRLVNETDLEWIRQLREAFPHGSRQQLSVHLAQEWQWRNQAGRLKDMAARTLLLKLHARGLIELPVPLRGGGNHRAKPLASGPVELELPLPAPASIEGALHSLRPLNLEFVESPTQRRRVGQLLKQHHYRGYSGAVGETVQYLATDALKRELAVLVFGAAAWRLAARDQFIGWSDKQRTARLGWIANHQRFLILPWVKVPHLASHLLALALRRLSIDWQSRYGHPVWLVETFVDQERFAGTAYKSAGWRHVGSTTGRTRQDRNHTLHTPLKTIWVRALHPQFQNLLTSP